MYKAKKLSPIIPSFDIEKTVSFFADILDFKVGRNDKTYVILYKDNSTVHILRAGSDIGEMELYFNMRDKLEGIKIAEPFDREYGMREVHVVIPETKTLMLIGQELK